MSNAATHQLSTREVVAERPMTMVRTVVDSGRLHDVAMRRLDVAVPMTRLTVMTENGPRHSMLARNLTSYEGTLPSGERVVQTFNARGSVQQTVLRPTNRMRSFNCLTDAELIPANVRGLVERAVHSARKSEVAQDADDTLNVQLAIDVDYQLYSTLKTVDSAAAYVVHLTSLLSAIYLKEVSVQFELTSVRIWEIEDDPYPSDIDTYAELMDWFVAEYKKYMSNVDRDMSVLLTSRSPGNGLARSIGGICTDDGSYCLGDCSGDLSTELESYTADVFMMAHEFGHLMGSLHTQSCMWPQGALDSCTFAERGDCIPWWYQVPTRGTLMSYCHQLLDDGATIAYEFHPMCRNVVDACVRSAPCLTTDPPRRMARIFGVVTNAVTGEPIGGMQLTLRRFYDQKIMLAPTVDGDTVVVSQPDGTYEFKWLGYGIYSIDFDKGWVVYPPPLDYRAFQNTIQVCEYNTQHDMQAARGNHVEFRTNVIGPGSRHYLNYYSNALPQVEETQYVTAWNNAENDSMMVGIADLPVGRYVVVPAYERTLFTPNKAAFDVKEGNDTIRIFFEAYYTGDEDLTSFAVCATVRPPYRVNDRMQLKGDLPYRIIEEDSNTVIREGVLDADGVAVIDSVSNGTVYHAEIDVDTNMYAPLWLDQAFPIFSDFSAMAEYHERQRPLIARQYTLRTSQGTYQPLIDPHILVRYGDTTYLQGFDMPFTLRIADREFVRCNPEPYAQLVFNDGFSYYDSFFDPDPFSHKSRSPFIVTALATDLEYEGDLEFPWSIAWDTRGEEPNRELIVEWKNVKYYDSDDIRISNASKMMSIQVVLHESGTINMIYDGPDSLPGAIGAYIGLRGNDVYDNVIATTETTLLNATSAYYPDFHPPIRIKSPQDFFSGLTFHWEFGVTSAQDDNDRNSRQQHHPSNELSIYPSIGSGIVTISGLHDNTSICIVDALGMLAARTIASPANPVLNLTSLSSGRYTLQIESDKKVEALPFYILR